MPGADKTPAVTDRGALNRRKEGHIDVCLDSAVDLASDSFTDVKLVYNALPEISRDNVTTGAEFAGRSIAAPLIISSMTGGAGERFRRINENLARAAEALRLPLGLGSMKVLLRDEAAAPSFLVRDLAPSIPLIANLGLVSFNYGLSWEDVELIIERTQPDVFCLHLNALQESIQEGGDTDFRGLRASLAQFVERSTLPVYVKECGGGISPALVAELAAMGVDYVDISGSDGTSWAAVEARLSQDPSMGELFRDFGLPTRWILERIERSKVGKTRIVASGGIRNGLQAVKALALGADYVAVARPFLEAATESPEAVIRLGQRLIDEMRNAMFLVGAASPEALGPHLVVRPDTIDSD